MVNRVNNPLNPRPHWILAVHHFLSVHHRMVNIVKAVPFLFLHLFTVTVNLFTIKKATVNMKTQTKTRALY